MFLDVLIKILPVAVLVLGIALVRTLDEDRLSVPDIKRRDPIVYDTSASSSQKSKLSEPKLETFNVKPQPLPGSWPAFRGPNLDGISPEKTKLARSWPNGKPPVLWSVKMGDGYAAAAVLDGRVYVIDYDQDNRADMVRCLSLATGQDIWRYIYPVVVLQNHGISRTVPAVTEKYVVTLGPKCHVTGLDSKTGKHLWNIDLVKQYHTTVPNWYAGQCPIIDNDVAIIAPGNDALLIAVDCATGNILWETPNPNKWKMSHASVVPAVIDGKKVYIYCADGGVVAVDPDDGRILWETTEWRIRLATIPTPVVIGDGRIFFSGGYKAGSLMVRLIWKGNRLVDEVMFKLTDSEFGAYQQTPIFYKGNIYGVTEKTSELVCMDLQGRRLWSSGHQRTFGWGPYTIADGLIFVMDNNGNLSVVEATEKGFQQHARAPVIEHGYETWGPMAIAGGRLIFRDRTRMICLDIRAKDD